MTTLASPPLIPLLKLFVDGHAGLTATFGTNRGTRIPKGWDGTLYLLYLKVAGGYATEHPGADALVQFTVTASPDNPINRIATEQAATDLAVALRESDGFGAVGVGRIESAVPLNSRGPILDEVAGQVSWIVEAVISILPEA